jgi:hypothetical protein
MATFTDLPPEIQRLISLEGRPRDVRALRQVSPSVKRTLEPVYTEEVKKLCERSLAEAEYLAVSPPKVITDEFSYFIKPYSSSTYRGTVYTRVSANQYRPSRVYTYSLTPNYELKLTVETPSSTRSEDLGSIILLSEGSSPQDLNLVYRAYRRRLPCERLNPNFARNHVLGSLDSFSKFFRESSVYKENSDYTLNYLKLFVYLLLNAESLGIPINPSGFKVPLNENDLRVSTSTNSFVRKLVAETERLEGLVRSAIQKFD